MRTTIDAAGRIVIPKKLREQAGLAPGMPVDVRVCDGRIEIEPAALPVRFERRGRMLVAVPMREVGTLTAEMVEQTRERIRQERGDIE